MVISKKSNEKLEGLVNLKEAGYNVPEWIYLDEKEYWNYMENSVLSPNSLNIISRFLMDNINDENSLFAIRAESKRGTKKKKRPPLSLLNVGIMCENKNLSREKELREVYIQRAKLIDMDIKFKRTMFDEILENLYSFYKNMSIRLQNDKDYNYGVIIQKMVYGNKGEFSGNGIICRSTDELATLNGVFLVKQIGVGVKDGSWGENEISLEQLKILNPDTYNRIIEDYYALEKKYGGYIYLEFTVEDNKVYYLDFIKRRKNICVEK